MLVGAALSFALPLGAEADHGHDHGDAPTVPTVDDPSTMRPCTIRPPPHPVALAATVAGGVAASGVVLLTLVLPPASLSAELAMSRDVGAPPLFAGSDAVTLAATGDTASFGVGEWATVFATATNPDAFDGDAGHPDRLRHPRRRQRRGLRSDAARDHALRHRRAAGEHPGGGIRPAPETGQWVTITGTVSSTADGRLEIDATSVEPIDEPADPYEY